MLSLSLSDSSSSGDTSWGDIETIVSAMMYGVYLVFLRRKTGEKVFFLYNNGVPCLGVDIYICVCVWMQIYICMCVCVCGCKYIYICMCVCVFTFPSLKNRLHVLPYQYPGHRHASVSRWCRSFYVSLSLARPHYRSLCQH